MSEGNKALVRRVIEGGTNAKDLSVFDELVSVAFVDHEAGPEPGGPEGEKSLMEIMTVAFPDWRWSMEDQIAEGDKVVTRYTARGTHRGDFMGIPPTEQEIEVPGINIICTEGDKIVESWGSSDQLGLLRRPGAVL